MVDISEKEFENLPPAVKRKFLSSLERLNLTQHSPGQAKDDDHAPRHLSTRRVGKPRSNSVNRRGSLLLSRLPSLHKASLNRADARHFLDLPERIKAKHFTSEELSFLKIQCANILPDVMDDDSCTPAPQRAKGAAPASKSTPPKIFRDSVTERRVLNMLDVGDPLSDSLRWLEEDAGALDLQLSGDDYHSHLEPDSSVAALPEDGRRKRPSFRRAACQESRVSGLNPTLLANPTPTPAKLRKELRRKSSSADQVMDNGTGTRLSVSSVDHDATYYRDPEARLKLRVYLASPQKFDEAIEFGFPPMDGARKSVAGIHTFLADDDDAASLPPDAEDDDGTSSPDTDQPVTPSEIDTTFRSPHRFPYAAKLHTSDSTLPTKHTGRPRAFESYAFAPAENREMTMRLTLTRPDLRPHDTVTYSLQGREKDDPLALGDLPPLTDRTGLQHASKSSSHPDGIVKKFWKMVKPGLRIRGTVVH